MTIKCDFHVHSRFSVKPTNWITQSFGAPESFTEPKFLYKRAMERGMSHVTITDHDTIDGALELMALGHDNTFVSCEITASFPEDKCHTHVLIYDVTEDQYKEAMRLRSNIRELVIYLRRANIWHAIAHPLYSVNNKITQDHFEELFLMFNLIELNGYRGEDTNKVVRKVTESLTDKLLEKLADKHGTPQPLTAADDKYFIRGSDDHGGTFIAMNYTMNAAGDNINVVFDNPEANAIIGKNATPRDLAHAIYSVGYQHLGTKANVKKYVRNDHGLAYIDRILRSNTNLTNSDIFHAFIRAMRRHKSVTDGTVKSSALKYLNSLDSSINLDVTNVSKKWFDIVSGTVDFTVRDMVEQIVKTVESGNIFNTFKTIGNMMPLLPAIIPYYVAYFVFQQTRNFSESLDIEGEIVTKSTHNRIAHFTDVFYEINGVARTLQQIQTIVDKNHIDYSVITCYDTKSKLGETVFKPVMSFPIPNYEEIVLPVPPLLEMIDFCYERNFTHIHAATPGPMGLAAMLIAKILQKPFYSTYHTAFPQYTDSVLNDKFMTDTCWAYVKWFYNRCDKVFVPSYAFMEELVEHGVNRDKLVFFERGIDIERFRPARKINDENFYLIYVGRISEEKGLKILVDAFKALDNPKLRLIVVGDGPYREEMEKALEGYEVTFTGRLEGESLVQVYQQADLFVLPSTSDTFGNVVLEAHACGLPTLITDEGGPAENVVDGETGFVVKGNDVEAFKQGILKALDKDKLKEMGDKALKSMETRSFEAALLNWLDLY